MNITTDYIPPQDLTGFARGALADLSQNEFKLSAWLPDIEIDDLDYRFTTGGEGLADAATFRQYDAESSIGSRPGVTRVTGELPPVSRKIRLGEYDRLRQRHLTGSIVNGLYNDAERMTRAVAARIELARGAAISGGALSISENGVVATVTFGRASGHTAQTPSTAWSTSASATPIADLLAWQETYKTTNNGVKPGAIIMPSAVRSNMLRTAEVRGYAAVAGVSPSIVSNATLAAILDAYDLPPIYVNDEMVNVNGAATRVIPAKNVILAPAPGPTSVSEPEQGSLGATLWGTTAESLEPEYEGVGAGIVAGNYSTKDPVAVWTKAAAIALPVLANPNLTFQAVVLP